MVGVYGRAEFQGVRKMELRERLQAAVKEAMKAKQAERLSTLRMVSSAIKDREIAARGEGGGGW